MADLDDEDGSNINPRSKNRSAADDAAMVDLMKSRGGRRTMWRTIEYAGLNLPSFTGNSQTFFNEGKRDVAIWLRSQLVRLCHDSYQLMERENMETNR
jgi:hypothetical protein